MLPNNLSFVSPIHIESKEFSTKGTLRYATIEDAHRLSYIINEAYVTQDFWKKCMKENTKRINLEQTIELINHKKGKLIVIESKSPKILFGCVFVEIIEKNFYFGTFCVDPKYQNLKIGSQMIQRIDEIAKYCKCDKIVIDVVSIRHSMIEWYLKRGFKKIKWIPWDDYWIQHTTDVHCGYILLEKEL